MSNDYNGRNYDNRNFDDRDRDILRGEQSDTPQGGFGRVANSIGTRNLLTIILTMPLAFIAVVAGIIMTFGSPDKNKVKSISNGAVLSQLDTGTVDTGSEPTQPLSNQSTATDRSGSSRVVLPIPAATATLGAAIALPVDATPGSIALDGDRLAVRVDSEAGTNIVIYDLAAGQVVRSVPLVQQNANQQIVRSQSYPSPAQQPAPQPAQQYAVNASDGVYGQPGVKLSTPTSAGNFDPLPTIDNIQLVAPAIIDGIKSVPTPSLADR